MRLRKIRIESGYSSAKEVASALGIPYTTYLSYEKYGIDETTGRAPDIPTLKKIATFFDVSIDYLLEQTNKKNDEEGYIISVDELKKRYPELSVKLDEVGATFLKLTEDDIDYEHVLEFVQWALSQKAKQNNQ